MKFLRTLYNLRKILLSEVYQQGSVVIVTASSTSKTAKCNKCGKKSHLKRSCYTRKLKELPFAGYSVEFQITAFRYKCTNPVCEQLDGFTSRYSRRSIRTNEYLKNIIIEVSSNKAFTSDEYHWYSTK